MSGLSGGGADPAYAAQHSVIRWYGGAQHYSVLLNAVSLSLGATTLGPTGSQANDGKLSEHTSG